ncbi:MAG: hypothetical protein PW734_00555 [Verrucomicrobium sp.]|nr:hypothetical protein [Verrucomicrobium sp.]
MITALDHILLATPDRPEAAAAARRFFGTLLGLKEVPMPSTLEGRAHCWFQCGALTIHIGPEKDFRPAKKAHPAFLVADLNQVRAALEKEGHPIRADDAIQDVRRFFSEDPWGNRLEFLQRVTE